MCNCSLKPMLSMGSLDSPKLSPRYRTASEDSLSDASMAMSVHSVSSSSGRISEGSGLKRSRKSENLLHLDDSTHDIKRERRECCSGRSAWKAHSRNDDEAIYEYVCSIEEAELRKRDEEAAEMIQSFDMILLKKRAPS
jgi:hypothetical protein